MGRIRTKQDLISAINKADVLEVYCELIERKKSDSAKKISVNEFVKQFQKAVVEQRDLILACVKIR